MIEPTTISVPNLATRWSQTTREILEYAANLRLHLLFNFDGLVFDFNDDWLPFNKDARQRRELEALTSFVESAEGKFKRLANGQLSQWESLDKDEAVSLRAELTAKKQAIQALNELFDDRDRKRKQKHYRGTLMAAPETVDQLKRLGFAKHPILAYRPEGPFTLSNVKGGHIWDGPIVRLEPSSAQWVERLEPADMVVSMAAVKAIEAAAKPPQTATTPPAPPVVAAGASGGMKRAQARRRTWHDVTETYLFETFKAEQYPTAKDFYKILERKAGAGSPFDRGTGPNLGSLLAREVCEKVTLKMIRGAVTDIRKKL